MLHISGETDFKLSFFWCSSTGFVVYSFWLAWFDKGWCPTCMSLYQLLNDFSLPLLDILLFWLSSHLYSFRCPWIPQSALPSELFNAQFTLCQTLHSHSNSRHPQSLELDVCKPLQGSLGTQASLVANKQIKINPKSFNKYWIKKKKNPVFTLRRIINFLCLSKIHQKRRLLGKRLWKKLWLKRGRYRKMGH